VSEFTYRFREKFGIVSVAHGKVDGNVALLQMGQDKLLLQRKKI
jgi:hypothetical protein